MAIRLAVGNNLLRAWGVQHAGGCVCAGPAGVRAVLQGLGTALEPHLRRGTRAPLQIHFTHWPSLLTQHTHQQIPVTGGCGTASKVGVV